jgi:hypothetical protein
MDFSISAAICFLSSSDLKEINICVETKIIRRLKMDFGIASKCS